ncbi:MAG: hypothetical protein WCY89_08965 [Flavobacteriaceae bacterium]
MSTADLDTVKVDLVRYILNETDTKVIEKIMRLVYEKKETAVKPKSLASHLGKLKRGIDGLAYQKAVRNEWD